MKIKKQKLAAYVMLLVILILAMGCSNENAEGLTAEDSVSVTTNFETDKTGENDATGDAPVQVQPHGDGQDAVVEPEIPNAMIPAVMVDNVLYFDTGYNSCMPRCGMLDGNITSSVSGTQLPEKNGEANFDGAEGFQYGLDEGTIEVYMNNEWRVFATEEVRTTDYIPSGVPHFMAVVRACYEDGTALVAVTKNVNDSAWMLEENGEYILPPDYLVYTESTVDGVPAETPNLKTATEVEIWFDGSMEETEPAQLGRVYRIAY